MTKVTPLGEAEEVARLARRHGKGIEVMLFGGDGYEDLITVLPV